MSQLQFLYFSYDNNVTYFLLSRKSKGNGSCPENISLSPFMCEIVSISSQLEGKEGNGYRYA